MPTTAIPRDDYNLIETVLGCSIAANMIAFEKYNPKKPEDYGTVFDRMRANALRSSIMLDAGRIARDTLACASIVPEDTIEPVGDNDPPERDPGPPAGMLADLERAYTPERNGRHEAGVVASTVGLHPGPGSKPGPTPEPKTNLEEPDVEPEIVAAEIDRQLPPPLEGRLAVPSRPYTSRAPNADGSVSVIDNEGNLIAQFFPPLSASRTGVPDKFRSWAAACARNLARSFTIQPDIVEFLAKVADNRYDGRLPETAAEEAAHLYTLIIGDMLWTTGSSSSSSPSSPRSR